MWRAVRRRCPVCGGGDVFASWGELKARCPTCGFSYAREEGYFVGTVIVNLGVAQVLFMILFVGGMALTWPDVPWLGLALGTGLLVVVFPVWFYPRSKLLWVWADLLVNPYSAEERSRDVDGS